MKHLVLKYNKIVASIALVFTFVFVASCADNDEDSMGTEAVPATVTGYYPNNAKEGGGVIIQGTNFSVKPQENTITFNGIKAVVRSSTRTTLLTTVPVGATTGAVSVVVKEASEVAGPSFTVLLPTIASFAPAKAGVGEVVTITGANFSTTASENKVWFGSVLAVVTEATSTSLTTTVPTGAATGLISVQVKEGTKITGASFEVTTEITFELQLTELNDDVEEAGANAEALGYTPGTMDLNSSDLELGEIDSWYGTQVIGMRYRNVTIPKGATIISATIQFECDATGAGPVNLRIHGENIGNSPEYIAELFNVSTRSKTTANALWTVAPWLAAGDRLPAQKTVDLKDIVQEIVNRADWAANNAMNFIFTQEGANSSTGSDGREAETSKSTGKGATITIVYE